MKENKIMVLPPEIQEMALQISEKKQKEVQTVLNQIFTGTSEWNKQVDAINVKDINDIMSIELADTARKNAKTARVGAEKIFDAKRADVQNLMRDFKLEDSLWLKAKQIMQLKFKDIEDKAKYKADFVIRYQLGVVEKLQIERASKLEKFEVKVIPDYLGKMEKDVWENYIAGLENNFKLQKEAKERIEKERIEKERIEKERIEKIRLENEKLKKEAELKEQKRIADEKIRLEKERKEQQEREEKAEKEREEREEKQRIADEKLKKEQQEREEKQRIENEKQAKILEAEKQAKLKAEKELSDKLENEKRIEVEKQANIEAELKKGDSAKINDLKNDLETLKTKYSFKSKTNQKLYSDVSISLDKIINHLN